MTGRQAWSALECLLYALLAVALLLGFAALANAAPPPVKVAQPATPATVTVPAVEAVYDPTGYRLEQMEKRLAALEAKLDKVLAALADRPTSAQSQTAPAAKPTFAGVVKARCASCHAADVAEDKGGGFVLLENGRPISLDKAERKAAVRAVKDGSMPKGLKMTADESAVLLEEWEVPK